MSYSGFYEIFPIHPPNIPGSAQAIQLSASDTEFNCCVNFYRNIGGKDYPYCKLEFINLLYERCKETKWVEENILELLKIYFCLICDTELLFSQTRELTDSSSTIAYSAYMTNMRNQQQPKRAEIVDLAIQKLVESFEMDTSLNSTNIAKEHFTCILETIRGDLCPSRGKPRQVIEFPSEEQIDHFLRDQCESRESWILQRNQEIYESAKVFGIPAMRYYSDNIAGLNVPEDSWKEMVTKYLPRLAQTIEVIKSKYSKYIPYLLPNQRKQFQMFQEDVKHCTKNFVGILKSIDSIPFRRDYAESEGSLSFQDNISLPNKMSTKEKLCAFEHSSSLQNHCLSPQTMGIFFLLRSHLHPLFGKKIVNYPKFPSQQAKFTSIEDGYRYFDEIQSKMMNCIHYTARNLMSIDNMHIKLEYFESESPELAPYVQRKLRRDCNWDSNFLESYRKLFYSPVYQKEPLHIILQKVANAVDWEDVPLLKSVEKYPGQFSLKQRAAVWKMCLVEYQLMQCLIEDGYRQLQEIARKMFRVLGDS